MYVFQIDRNALNLFVIYNFIVNVDLLQIKH